MVSTSTGPMVVDSHSGPTRPHKRGKPCQLQKAWQRMHAQKLPVLKNRKASNHPKTVVYVNWNRDRAMAAKIETLGWRRRNSYRWWRCASPKYRGVTKISLMTAGCVASCEGVWTFWACGSTGWSDEGGRERRCKGRIRDRNTSSSEIGLCHMISSEIVVSSGAAEVTSSGNCVVRRTRHVKFFR